MNREQRRTLKRATHSTKAAGGDPAVAAELDQLRRVRTGSYALMQVLIAKLGGGPIEIPRAEWKALPPNEKLKVQVDPTTHDVRLWIEQGEGEATVEGL